MRLDGKISHFYTQGTENISKIQDIDLRNALLSTYNPKTRRAIIDEFNSSLGMCGLALLENVNDETFSVEKIVQFYQGHRDLDEAFHWGLNWRAGRK